jgi:DNA helicase-2/ATP-dependent DNA helicase PcrA
MEVNLWLGPPGTGKTHKLMDILEDELKTTAPEKIAYVTFTKKGAEEGVTRALERFPQFKRNQFPYFRTLHSLAFKQMELRRNNVMNWDDYRTFSKKIGMHFVGYYTEDLVNNDDKYLFWIDLYRNNPKAANAIMGELDTLKLDYVRRSYKEYKRTFARIDYTDMVEQYIHNNISVPVEVAIIDEAQDLTTLQWRMVLIAFRRCKRIYIAGDDDQAIYQWSGADVDYFLGITGSINVLRHSHRLPKLVLDFSKKITSQIGQRIEKAYSDKGEQGEVIYVNDINEVPINLAKSYMFLSRNNTFLDAVDTMLMRRGCMFAHKGEPKATQSDLEVIKTYERVRKALQQTTDEGELITKNFKEGDLTHPWYDRIKWKQDKIDYMRDIIKNKITLTKPMINVSTIHSVKGGEADNVVLLLDVTKSVYENLQTNPDSEHRVFYVGATRAKEKLYVVNAKSRYSYPLLP